MNASTPCTKSRWSYSSSAVAFVGAPSRNSSVPSRVSTRSGVEIDLSVSADILSAPPPLIASSVIVARVTEIGGATGAMGAGHQVTPITIGPAGQVAVPGPGGDLDRGAAGRVAHYSPQSRPLLPRRSGGPPAARYAPPMAPLALLPGKHAVHPPASPERC